MKALVLCGGIPQIALMKELKTRGISVVLADMNENVGGRPYAEVFYPVSVLDAEGIKTVAVKEKVDFVITVCADQVLQVMAQVSEELGLPCYIDYTTSVNVSKKSFMKKIFMENNVPTSKYVTMKSLDYGEVSKLEFPLIVKPVDSYSSKGVCKVNNRQELIEAFEQAVEISRTKVAIIEEFVEGRELTVDVYVEDGQAHLLCISELNKVGNESRFVIYRTNYPANISDNIYKQIQEAAQKIANSFELKNTPMLIQLITNGDKISIIEFCARTGGGDKFRLIEKVSGFNVIKAVVDLTLGIKPHVEQFEGEQKFILDEFLYCEPGTFDHLEGFDDALCKGLISEYYQLKTKGTQIGEIASSADRVAYFTIESDTYEELKEKHKKVNQIIKAIDSSGRDFLRHDIIGTQI